MGRSSLLIAALAALLAGPAAADLPVAWTLPGLADPESVAISVDNRTLYVTNVAGEGDAKDGNGFISRVSPQGRMIERTWVTGLDAPTGAIVQGGRLWVSDITQLVEIDIATSRVAARHLVAGATFLNDVAALSNGTVLVADSGTGRIFALRQGVASVWLQDPLLRAVNGLLPEANRLLVTTMAGRLLAIEYATRRITVLAEGLGNGDGVAPAGGGDYYVSEWPGRLYRVTPGGAVTPVMDGRKAETYINDFIRVGNILIVPHWKPGALTAYRVPGRLRRP